LAVDTTKWLKTSGSLQSSSIFNATTVTDGSGYATITAPTGGMGQFKGLT